uniref:Macaca fascicularis brain cDNA clone: QmoA-12030, similar to human hypothetical gene supported by AL833273; NM_014644(LOC399701), mRNA, RefSeq: XM_378185.1 n=1 Tax=Macaca fascicularis TaxID=9541 RepID=I7G8N5_MACFA|nr:unnamed protein product [Macaca fascicularis]
MQEAQPPEVLKTAGKVGLSPFCAATYLLRSIWASFLQVHQRVQKRESEVYPGGAGRKPESLSESYGIPLAKGPLGPALSRRCVVCIEGFVVLLLNSPSSLGTSNSTFLASSAVLRWKAQWI